MSSYLHTRGTCVGEPAKTKHILRQNVDRVQQPPARVPFFSKIKTLDERSDDQSNSRQRDQHPEHRQREPHFRIDARRIPLVPAFGPNLKVQPEREHSQSEANKRNETEQAKNEAAQRALNQEDAKTRI